MVGNTPTCVGKTDLDLTYRAHHQKHPHLRGEDVVKRHADVVVPETPPPAWGRLPTYRACQLLSGNTPTCVGKTQTQDEFSFSGQKHPHLRGEDLQYLTGGLGSRETPPPAWGRLNRGAEPQIVPGNTPTCVGKTPKDRVALLSPRKHPHLRGEDFSYL